MRKITIVFLLSLSISLCAEHQRNVFPFSNLHADTMCIKGLPIHFEFLGLELITDSNSVKSDFTLSAYVLHKSDLAPLHSNMRNVTGDMSEGYRLLPCGEHFDKPAILKVPFSESVIPTGYTPKDVYTFYYDTVVSQWVKLERVAVDTEKNLIISKTTHFTDFINAIIQTPEMPEVEAYVPTTMTEIEHPNPLSKIHILGEPQANAYGNATLTYPIEIPKGRNGLQPNIDLSYNSNGGNSILGVGWNIPLPAITIDTRWGVPRYDREFETELYCLDNEQLVLKTNNDDLLLQYQSHKYIRRDSTTDFVKFIVRDIENTDVVIRYGTNPTNYWWKVISSDGLVKYYGKRASDNAVNNEYVLRDDQNNIAYWALGEVEDISGNGMTYYYDVDNVDREIYLTRIQYTWHKGTNFLMDEPPVYTIYFHYTWNDFPSISGRLGFLRKTKRQLCYLQIENSEDTYIYKQRYSFQYQNINKNSYLTDIIRSRDLGGYNSHQNYDLQGHQVKNCHCDDHDLIVLDTIKFDYYKQSWDQMFSQYEDTIQDIQSNDKNYLNVSTNNNWSLGGTLTVGFGSNPWNTNFSVGGNYDYSESTGKNIFQLLDINGDALADKVYCKNDSIFFRRQVIDSLGILYFDNEQNTGIKSPNLSKETSKTHAWGLQTGVDPIISVSGGASYTDSYTKCFFADVNADGLPDFIDDGAVYFNRINTYGDFLQHNGKMVKIPTNPDACQSYFYYDGAVELDSKCYVDTMLLDSFTIILPDTISSEYLCGDCEEMCRRYLYNDEPDFLFLCLDCVQHCDISLLCDECNGYDCNGDPNCIEQKRLCIEENGCVDICPKCLEYYLNFGVDSEEYIRCADSACIFKGQETICEECRDICISRPWECHQCVYDNYMANREYSGPVDMYGNEICEECAERCPEGADPMDMGVIEDCNQCKEEFQCKGVLPNDALELYSQAYVTGDFTDLINILLSEDAICEECFATCFNNPEECVPCLHRHCYYQNENIDSVFIKQQQIKQIYPNAQFFKRGNTFYAYQSMTICPEDDFNSIAPNLEAVKVWVAPRDGIVDLTSTINLIEDRTRSRQQSRTADGVQCIIQHNQSIDTLAMANRLVADSMSIIDIVKIPATDYSVHTKRYTNIDVATGDVFFFHLNSRASHSFDNVNWKQIFTYSDTNTPYSSENDFTCYSKEVFQPDTTLGVIYVNFDINTNSTASCVLKVNANVQNTDNTITSNPIEEYVISSSTLPITDLSITNIQPNTTYSLVLQDNGELGKVQVKTKFTHVRPSETGSINDTIISYLAPQLDFIPEVHLGSTYYDLFGSLYKGWGQFAYNNMSGSEIILLDSLYNTSTLQVQTMNQGTFTETIGRIDTSMLSDLTYMQTFFDDNNLYNPADNTSSWVEMKTDAKEWRWEAYGRIARNGRTLMSNTRDRKAAMNYFSDSYTETNYSDWEVTDNVVPVAPNSQTRITAINKKSSSKQWNVSWGVGMGPIGIGKSITQNTYNLCADYMDVNGDRFPDIIQETSIQYTQPWGGLGKAYNKGNSSLFETEQYSVGHSFSGTYTRVFNVPTNNPKNHKFATSASGTPSVNASGVVTSSATLRAFIDVNGDGLADKVYDTEDSIKIYLNIGYGFIYAGGFSTRRFTNFSVLGTSNSINTNNGVSFGFGLDGENILGKKTPNNQVSKYQVSLSLGTSASCSYNETTSHLIDIDANGHLDIVRKKDGNLIVYTIAYDEDGRWWKEDYNNNLVDTLIGHLQYSQTSNGALNLGVTGGFSIGVFKLCAGIHGTPVSYSETVGDYDIIDMNGDGLPDLVRSDMNGIYVRYNQMGKQGLLKTVNNSTGNKIELSYRLSDPSIRQSNRHWVLDSVFNIDTATPLGGNVYAQHYIYTDPYYSPEERTSYGYGRVITEELDIISNNRYHVYRKNIRHYNNYDFAEHGKLIADSLLDAAGNLYKVYEITKQYVDKNGNHTDDVCNDTKVKVETEMHYTHYYEGASEPITTAKQYKYDKYHNVIKYNNYGDIELSDDDFETTISYASATSGFNKTHNLVSLPQVVETRANGEIIRETRANYNSGKLISYTQINPNNSSENITTLYDYDICGLPSKIAEPGDQNGDQIVTEISYDIYSHTLPTTITNQFGSNQMQYLPLLQVPISKEDAAGQTISYTYDILGRLTSISAPNESLVGEKSIQYSYYPSNRNDSMSYIDIVTNMDGIDSTRQRLFYDSRGRLVQQMERREDRWLITNSAFVDNFGRAIEMYMPEWWDYDPDISSYVQTSMTSIASMFYDIQDRLINKTWQDGTQQYWGYGIENDAFGKRRLLQEILDENGMLSHTFYAPQGWQTTRVMPDDAITKFVYDPLGQLISTTNPDGLSTTYVYDKLGRMIERFQPDAGLTRWSYDNAGNMISSATQRQIDDGVQTDYIYHLNRLTDVIYPMNPAYNVSYIYDDIGRVERRIDATGYESFTYDAMGNVASSERLIALPNEGQSYVFRTHYKYDSFGKIQSIIYPDQEIVSYNYRDGLLKSISGHHNQLNSNLYVSDILYNEYDQPIELYYGNGDYQINNYDYARQWLVNKALHSGSGHHLQELLYYYDAVGNILQIEQIASSADGLGGAYNVHYAYDPQNRLIFAAQSSDELPNYSFDYSYSPAGRMNRKIRPDIGVEWYYGYKTNQDGQTYNHQIGTIFDGASGETALLSWNADGQLERISRPCYDEVRQHQWNEAGQMVLSVDNQFCGYYAYDAMGNRAYKLTGYTAMNQVNAGELHADLYFDYAVLYVNPYMTVTPRGYTKHYYNGHQHIASQIGTSSLLPRDIVTNEQEYTELAQNLLYSYVNTPYNENMNTICEDYFMDTDGNQAGELQPQCMETWQVAEVSYNCDNDMLLHVFEDIIIEEPQIFYSHSDHLGSASWITDMFGTPVQYIHYMPYGELLVDQTLTDYNERFKFTGKERDDETGYDFFGARYHASALPSWLSVDPLADKYPGVSPYAYCAWNPIKYVDPDGRDWYETEDGSVAWTDYKSQQAMDEAKVIGKYLGEAVVIVNGHWDEHVGSDKKLDSEDANPASITIYGRNGVDDILEYNGLTVTSDPSLYSMMEVGDYQMKQEQMATSIYGKNSLTYRIYTNDGNSKIPTANGEINKQHSNQGAYLLSVFMHRTNNDGNAYGNPCAGKPVSAACLLIDGRYWSLVEKQLGNSQNIFLHLRRQ